MNRFLHTVLPFRLPALLVCLALVVFACKDDNAVAPDDPADVAGVVVDAAGHAVPGAVLEVHDVRPSVQAVLASDTTDDDGGFSLRNLPGNGSTLHLRIRHPQYRTFVGGLDELRRTMENGRMRCALLNDDTCCGTLALTVADSGTAGVLSGVQVKLRRGNSVQAIGFTDTLGRIVFRNICAGEYNVRLARPGYRVVEQELAIDECDSLGLAILLHPNSSGADSCCNGVATVVVRDSSSLAALGGSTVKLWKGNNLLTALSANNDGVVRFTGLCPGEYVVAVLRDGYYGREMRFAVECSDTVELAGTIAAKGTTEDSCCRGVIHIVVRDSATNTVLTGAKVKIWKNNQLKAQETSGPNGAIVGNLCSGSYGISISRDGYSPMEFDVQLGCNDTLLLVRALASHEQEPCCNNRIKILVRDSTTAAPMQGAVVRLWKNGQVLLSKTTNADGYAVFEELCTGGYGVDISRDNYVPRELSVQVSCASNEQRTVSLFSRQSGDSCCGGVLKVIVRDSTTTAALGSTLVKLWKGNTMVASKTSNGDGVVIFHNLCPGTYSVSMMREQYNNREFSVEFGCSDTVTQTRLLLAKQNSNDTCETARLKVRVMDSTAQNSWLAGVTVTIQRNGVVVAEGTTNSEGWYLREQLLAPAVYTVTFSKQGYESKTVSFTFNECKTIQETIRIVPE